MVRTGHNRDEHNGFGLYDPKFHDLYRVYASMRRSGGPWSIEGDFAAWISLLLVTIETSIEWALLSCFCQLIRLISHSRRRNM
jgi:hypothetical protein